jgi:hypothetical protein
MLWNYSRGSEKVERDSNWSSPPGIVGEHRIVQRGVIAMAKYGKAAAESVKNALRKEKRGTLLSGKGGKGGKVTTRKQAIAIGLSEARKKGAKVPKRKT